MSGDPLPAAHLTDEDLLLDYYRESSPADRVRVHMHLASCAECRALDHELRSVLALVDSVPVAEPPAGFEREMWARVQPHVTGDFRLKPEATSAPEATSESRAAAWLPPSGGRSWSWWTLRPFAFAGGVAVLIIGAFFVGRLSYAPAPSIPRNEIVDAGDLRERVLRSEVGDHLERSQRVLVELVNADASASDWIPAERERAADLVAYGRLYRRSVEEAGDTGDAGLIELLDDLERVLIEVANGPAESDRHFDEVRSRISEQDLVFRVRVVSQELRERDGRTRVIW